MASSPVVNAAIDQTLDEIRTALNHLGSIFEDRQRGDLSEHERVTLSLEWDQEMHHLAAILVLAYRSGQMAPAQQARYCALLCQLKDALPTADKIGFAKPRISLDV